MDGLESQNSRDARVEGLWKRLDTLNKGELDLNGLRRGLRKIDHRQQIHVQETTLITRLHVSQP